MLVVFVAKDHGEFSRYARGLGLKKWPDKNTDARLVWKCKDDANIVFSVVFIKDADIKDTTRNNLNESTSENEIRKFIETIQEILMWPQDKNGDADAIAFLTAHFQEARGSQTEVSQVGETHSVSQQRARRRLQFEDGSTGKLFPAAVLFIHWGGGTPLDYERYFRNACKTSQIAKRVTAFALSSRRAELFDVTGSKIGTPKTYDELIQLENKFRNAQIDEAFSHCAAKHNWKITEDARKEIIDRLDRFAISVLNSSLNPKKKKELLQAVVKAKNEGFTNAKDTSDETATFMAKILNKEVFNG